MAAVLPRQAMLRPQPEVALALLVPEVCAADPLVHQEQAADGRTAALAPPIPDHLVELWQLLSSSNMRKGSWTHRNLPPH